MQTQLDYTIIVNIYKLMLNHKKSYLQIAFNNNLNEAYSIIQQLPASDRILIEVGTPLIKEYGQEAIKKISYWWKSKFNLLEQGNFSKPYIVADLKTMDRGQTEVEIAFKGGANAAIALGLAPIETLDVFIEECEQRGMDSMIDMMNVEYSLSILQKLKKQPDVVILHRGVDEEHYNKEKMLPLHEIRRIKSRYDMLVSVAGGDTIREVQKSFFNDADIVVIWKPFYQNTSDTANLVKQFLSEIK